MDNLNYNLANKTALVTGGSHGIGKAIVKSLLDHGSNVGFFGRTKSNVESTKSEFQKKYPGIDVNQSYKKFILNMKEKGRVFDDLVAAFEKWLIRDVERGWNPRDKSNDLVTLRCVVCDRPKEVKRGIEERTTNCCGEPMLFYNEYLHEKSRRKEEEDKKVK